MLLVGLKLYLLCGLAFVGVCLLSPRARRVWPRDPMLLMLTLLLLAVTWPIGVVAVAMGVIDGWHEG